MMRRARARSSSSSAGSRSCAAPRIPDSGLRISCASIAARPETDRAAPREVSARSIFSAIDGRSSVRSTTSGSSGSGTA